MKTLYILTSDVAVDYAEMMDESDEDEEQMIGCLIVTAAIVALVLWIDHNDRTPDEFA